MEYLLFLLEIKINRINNFITSKSYKKNGWHLDKVIKMKIVVLLQDKNFETKKIKTEPRRERYVFCKII